MIKNKKIFLGALSIATLTAPLSSVIACGSCDNSVDTSFDRLFKQARRGLIERLKTIEKINSSSLLSSDTAFQVDLSTSKSSADLGLILTETATIIPSGVAFRELYFVENVETPDSADNDTIVTIRASIAAIDLTSDDAENPADIMSNSTFLTITNFGVRYDLSTLQEINPPVGDASFAAHIADPKNAKAADIITVLNQFILEQLQLQAPQVTIADFEISNLAKSDGSAITDQDLTTGTNAFKATISAVTNTSLLKQTTVTINLPQLNWFDVSSITEIDASTDTWTFNDPTAVPTQDVVKLLNTKVLAQINQTNANVTWGDLFQIYTLDNDAPIGNFMDLSTSKTIYLYLTALPYSKNAVKNNPKITVKLPIATKSSS